MKSMTLRKIPACFLFMVLLLGQLNAAPEELSFSGKNSWVSFRMSSTPVVSVTGISSSNTQSKNFQWLILESNYYPQPIGNNYYFDDVTMDVDLMLLMTENKKNKNIMLLQFTGQSKYWQIEADRKEHKTMMLLPPLFVNRYLKAASSDPRKAELFARVVYKAGGQIIGIGYGSNQKHSDETLAAWFKEFDAGKTTDVMKFDNALIPRNQTLWNLVDLDKYEFEKTSK